MILKHISKNNKPLILKLLGLYLLVRCSAMLQTCHDAHLINMHEDTSIVARIGQLTVDCEDRKCYATIESTIDVLMSVSNNISNNTLEHVSDSTSTTEQLHCIEGTRETREIEKTEKIEEAESIKEEASTSSQRYIELTSDEKYMLATLIYLEGGIESEECQYAIGSVVLNRLTTGDYTNIKEVIYAEDQFSPAHKVAYSCPTQTQLDIVDNLITHGPTIPEYVTFFRADYYHEWGNLIDWKCMDRTYFSYDPRLYNQLTK